MKPHPQSKKRQHQDRQRNNRCTRRLEKFDDIYCWEGSSSVSYSYDTFLEKATLQDVIPMASTWSAWRYDYKLKRHLRAGPNPWEPAPEDTPDRKSYNDLMSMRLGSFAMPLPPGMDLMRGFDQPYPPVNPTIRVVDAETRQQYYPSELTIATPGAYRMRLIHPNGEDLTAKYHIQSYDTVTGQISYFHHGGPYDHGHTCIEYIHGIKIIMKP